MTNQIREEAKHLLRSIPRDDTPLTTKEELALNSYIRNKQSRVTHDLQGFYDEMIAVAGKKGTLNFLLKDILIMGIPYKWFLANAAIVVVCSIADMYLLAFGAMVLIHVGGLIYYQKNKEALRTEKIERLISNP